MTLQNYRLYWALGLSISMLQPLHVPFWTTWHAEFPLYITIAASLVVYSFVETPPRVYFRESLRLVFLVPLCSLVLLLIFQYVFGLIPFWGDLLLVGVYTAVFCVGYYWGSRDARSVELLAQVLFIASVANALICISQGLGVNDGWSFTLSLWDYRRPSGNLGQANNAGSLFVFGVIATHYLHKSGKFGRVSTFTVVVVLSLAIGLTQSRTALLGLVFCILYFLLRCRLNSFGLKRSAFLGVVFLLSFFWYLTAPTFQDAFHNGCWACFDEVGFKYRSFADSSGRAIIWPQMIEIGMLNPLIGGGLLQLSGYQLDLINSVDYKSLPLAYSHNIFLDAWVSMGLVGVVILILFFVGIFLVISTCKVAENNIFSVLVILMVAIHANFEFPHAYMYFIFPFGICLGRLTVSKVAFVEKRRGLSMATGVLATLMLVGGGLALKEYLQLEEDFRVARFQSLGIGQLPTDAVAADYLFFDQLSVVVNALRILPQRNMLDSDMQILKKAVRRHHWSALQHRYALSLALNGREDEAKKMLVAIKIFSGDDMYQRVLSQWANWSDTIYPELKVYQ
jgi:O-antigen ligase